MENRGKITLSKIERLTLSNQYRILERLYPEDSDQYQQNRKAIEEGFELHYEDCFSVLSEDTLTSEECREVIDILSMYRSITFSNKESYGIDNYDLKFRGFDLNDEYESKRVMYARYFINDLDRFEELKYGNIYADCNSHSLMMDKYRKMLAEWKRLCNKYELSKAEIQEIVEVR